MSEKLYAKRDIAALLKSGHLSRHQMAMTAEGLHSKAAIAAELAHRDAKIARLESELAEARKVPDGWEISFDDDKYNIGLVEKSTQGRIWICHDGNSDERMVWRLLRDIITAPQPPAVARESAK